MEQESSGPAPVIISPGVILAEHEWAATWRDAATVFQLQPSQVLCTPYGYLPMPRPPEVTAAGYGKVWPGVPFETALHPVFWLPLEVRRRLPAEADDTFAVRIYLALLDIEMLDPSTQRPLNPFVAADIDTTLDEVADDMADYIRGEDVGWLRDFYTAQPSESPGQMSKVATQLVEGHRVDFHQLKKDVHRRADGLFQQALQRLERAELARDAAALLQAGQQLEHAPRDPKVRSSFIHAVDAALEALDALDSDRFVATRACDFARRGQEAASDSGQFEQLAAATEARRDRIQRLAGPVLLNPTADGLRDLWLALAKAHAYLRTEGIRAGREARQLSEAR